MSINSNVYCLVYAFYGALRYVFVAKIEVRVDQSVQTAAVLQSIVGCHQHTAAVAAGASTLQFKSAFLLSIETHNWPSFPRFNQDISSVTLWVVMIIHSHNPVAQQKSCQTISFYNLFYNFFLFKLIAMCIAHGLSITYFSFLATDEGDFMNSFFLYIFIGIAGLNISAAGAYSLIIKSNRHIQYIT